MNRFFILLSLISGIQACFAQIIVPNEFEFVEGNSQSYVPFTDKTGVSMRFQQVYDASQFGSFMEEGKFISALAFRIDADQGRFHPYVSVEAQINFSTTQRSPDNLSSNYFLNVGPDDT